MCVRVRVHAVWFVLKRNKTYLLNRFFFRFIIFFVLEIGLDRFAPEVDDRNRGRRDRVRPRPRRGRYYTCNVMARLLRTRTGCSANQFLLETTEFY